MSGVKSVVVKVVYSVDCLVVLKAIEKAVWMVVQLVATMVDMLDL